MSKITVALGDDWEGLYLDGKFITQGHSMSHWNWEVLLKYLGHSMDVMSVNRDWLDYCGSLPENLDEVLRMEDPFVRPKDEEDEL